MMKKILLSVVATAAIAAAAMPAAAQSYQRGDRDGRDGYSQGRDYNRGDRDNRGGRYDSREYQSYRWNDGSRREWMQARRIDERQAALAQRIDMAARRGAISPGEARNFFFKLRNIEQLERGYKRHNRDLSRVEVRNLNYRLDLLTQELRYKART